MKMKKIMAAALLVGLISTPIVAKASGANQGAYATFGGTNSYANAWSGWYGRNCYLSATLGSASYDAWKRDWNQTTLKCKGDWNVYATHDYAD